MKRKYKDSGIEWIGIIPEEWKMQRLKSLCTIQTGNQDTQDAEPDGKYPFFVRSPNVERSNKYSFEGEGILMAGDGVGAGRVFHLASGKYAVHQRVYRLSNIKSVRTNYLYYFISNLFGREMDRGSAQSTVPSVRLPMLHNFNVCIPPVTVQQCIADYLDKKCGEIDSLIGLQEQMIEKLKAYKQSVITEAITKGLNPNARFVPTGIDWIGDIPEGWKVIPLKWILRNPLQYGANESGIMFDESLPRYVRITDILNNNLREDLQKQSLTEEQANGYILEDNDILFARSGGTVGKAFMYKSEYGRCAFAGYLIRAQINRLNDSKFIYYYTQSSSYDEWKKQIFIQATIQNIGADRYSILEIPLPSLSEQQTIASYLDDKCSEIDKLIDVKQQKIEKLKDYKKSVIYELVTGKTCIDIS